MATGPAVGVQFSRESTADVVRAAWQHALDHEPISDDADFFALGGTSFTAMSALAEVQERTGAFVTLTDLLEAPTLGQFVERVAAITGSRKPKARLRRRSAVAPMTAVQRERWRTRKAAPTGAEVYWLYEIEGPLDIDALRQAIDELVRRHEILRTTFRQRLGRARQVVGPYEPGLLRVVDAATEIPKRLRSTADAAQWIVDEDYGPFDYEQGPLIRPTLVVMGPRRYLLSIAANEMVIDGSSRRVLTTALNALYALIVRDGTADDYPFPPLQFADYAAERKASTKRSRSDQLLYWRTQVRAIEPGVPPRGFELRPTIDPNVLIPTRSMELPAGFVARIRATARELAMSPFNVLAAAFAVVVYAVCDTTRPAFTTTVSHRDAKGADQLIGTFFNIVLLSVPFDEATTVDDLFGATRAATTEALRNRDVPLAEAVRFRKQQLPDDSLFNTVGIRFQLHEDPGELRFPGVRMRSVEPPLRPMHQLYVAATERPDGGLAFLFSCRPDVPRRVVDNLLPTYRRMLDAMTGDRSAPLASVTATATRALLP